MKSLFLKKPTKCFCSKNFIQDFYNSNPNELLVDLMSEGLIQLSAPEKEKERQKEKEEKEEIT
jgi:hypothetical protein